MGPVMWNAIVIVSVLQLSLAQQPDCGRNADHFGTTTPVIGSNLGVCSTSVQQCCTHDIISMEMTMARNRLMRGLSLQLQKISSEYSQIVGLTVGYFHSTFYEQWNNSGVLPNPLHLLNPKQIGEAYVITIVNLTRHLVINDTSRNFSSEFVHEMVEAIGNVVANILSGGNRTCIIEQIRNSVNQTASSRMVDLIETLRKAVTTLMNLEQFLRDYSTNNSFMLPRICVDQLVNISVCPRCMRMIPPLCSNTCSALVRGCYSPYHEALLPEFDILWNVSIQLIDILNNTLHTLITEDPRLFEERSLTHLQQCGITLPTTTTSMDRSINIAALIPPERKQELNNLRGRGLSYGARGPLICQPNATDQQCTARENCSIDRICTSSCQCFNGTMVLTGNAQEFNVYGIEGQMQNPLMHNFNITELEMISAKIGRPVREYLMREDVRANIPRGVVIPPEVVDDGDDDDGDFAIFLKPNFVIIILFLALPIIMMCAL